jgi:protein-S-isoprenylcysteine O-methyltransferase Ste14
MSEPTLLFIAGCWAAWILYWLAMAFGAKRTVERGGFFGYRIVVAIVLGALILAGHLLHVSAQSQAWRIPLGLGVACDVVFVAGAAFTIWARVTLGRNWSAEVTFKEDHELIESGPYALARHPIYTGLTAMALATALDAGRAIGFAFLVALGCGLWWKIRAEERIMSSHFPDAYAAYRARVRAIIPFVL